MKLITKEYWNEVFFISFEALPLFNTFPFFIKHKRKWPSIERLLVNSLTEPMSFYVPLGDPIRPANTFIYVEYTIIWTLPTAVLSSQSFIIILGKWCMWYQLMLVPKSWGKYVSFTKFLMSDNTSPQRYFVPYIFGNVTSLTWGSLILVKPIPFRGPLGTILQLFKAIALPLGRLPVVGKKFDFLLSYLGLGICLHS